MADTPRALTRQQLLAFLSDFQAVRTFERMQEMVFVDMADAQVMAATTDARINAAADAIVRLAAALDRLALEPPGLQSAPPDHDLRPPSINAAAHQDLTPAQAPARPHEDLTPRALPYNTMGARPETITGAWTFTVTPVVPNDSWTYAKIQNVSATSRVLGRISAGAGDIEELTGANLATIIGTALGANPSASVGLTAVNGTASTYMRSDAAPALDQTIAPTMSGAWTFSRNSDFSTPTVTLASARPVFMLYETDATADNGKWGLQAQSEQLQLRLVNDSAGTTAIIMTADRTGTTLDNVTLGSGSATFTWSSTGTATFSGQVSALRHSPTSATASGNALYLPAANTPGISSNGSLVMSWDSSLNSLGKGSIKSDSATAGIGYATGAGGTVTQITSRTTGVTINKVSGAITLFSAAGSTTWRTFTVTNSTVAATDVVKVCQKSGADLNMIHVTAVAAGSFNISFATTGGTTVEQPVFNFAVIKAVTA